MRRLILAAAFAALMPATGAYAWCGSGVGYNCNIDQNSQSQSQSQKAYGGAGGAGGNSNQSQSLNNTNTNNNANSNSNTNEANNTGNNQSTSFSDVHQAPAFASGLAMSGQCTGEGFNAALSLVGGGGAIGYASVEKNCRKDIHIALGLSSGQADVVAQAKKDWFAMDADLFGHANADPTLPQTSSTSSAPAAIAPEQTASLPATCIGRNTNTIWYKQNCTD